VEEFQRTVQRLSITKVDRSEIATMQEFIVTAEATLKKLTKDKENSQEVCTLVGFLVDVLKRLPVHATPPVPPPPTRDGLPRSSPRKSWPPS